MHIFIEKKPMPITKFKNTLFILIGLFFTQFSQSQTLNIGHTTITFNDPNRTGGFGSGAGPGRQIQTEIYYPASTSGENVAVANGTWPLIVFGHGFAMTWDAYSNIWNQLIPLGYIMAFPRTESSLFPAPSHGDFGQDIALIAQKMTDAGQTSGSLFEAKISDYVCAMGHSMGGGAAILAAAQSTIFDAYLGLAPAETNPSAIAAAANIHIPSLILSGSNDGVTPPSQHHQPIYNAIVHDCKSLASLIGGGHCYFANTNFNCDFGESTSSTGISLSRAEQQNLSYQQITPWLAYFLDRSCSGFESFAEYPIAGIDLTTTCPSSVPDVQIIQNGNILSTATQGLSYQWFLDNLPIFGANNDTLIVPSNFSGTYNLLVTFDFGCSYSNDIAQVEEQYQAEFQVFPNPANELIFLNGQLHTATPYALLDVQGHVVQSGIIDPKVNSIEIKNLKNGSFFLKLSSKQQSIYKVNIAH
jgi:dienelactone hydrolase